MQLQICPSRETLQNYLNGRLDEEASKVLDQHLQDCQVCEQTATNLECDPDTFVEILGQHVMPELSHSEDLIESLQRLQAIREIDSASGEAKSEIISKIGGYAILARLGRGGMGNVYLAQHQQLGKQVALKVLPALLAKNPDALARFQREMRAVGKLDHATIVRATDAGQSDGYHFLVMERVQGLDVSQVARHCGPLSSADAAEIIRQAALGLSYAHAQGIVHRDIKPSNLMLSSDGNIKILDFGLAQISLWEEGAAEITTVGQLMGTLDYMAPEQAERQGAVDYRADLYSLGATLFRLLTGRAPLAASPHLTPLEKLRLLNEFSPPKIQTLRSDLPEAMCKIVGELLEHNPSKRPASAAHVAERLAALAQGANLRALLSQAQVKMEHATDSDDALAYIAPQSDGVSQKAQPQTSSRFGRVGRTLVGLAACLLPISIIAGIMLVVETQKGQLVIQSDHANVKVKIVSDQEQSQSFQIVPGTQSTKLKAGKYEIEFESPTDSYSLDKSQFIIKNGETIVATISDKPASVSVPETSAVSQGLVEPVYQGKNLDAWLRILQYEAGSNERAGASAAIEKIVNRQNETQIRERVLEILRTSPNREAFSILPQLVNDQFFVILTDLLEKSGNKSRFELIDWTGFSYDSITQEAFDHIDPYLTWLDARAMGDSNDGKLVRASANFFEVVLYSSDVSETAKSKIIDHISRWPRITDDNFWLKSIDELSKKSWSTPLYEAVFRRIQSVLADENSSDVLLAKATVTANFIAHKNRAVVENAIKANPAPTKSRLTIETKDIAHAIKNVSFGGPNGGVYEHYLNPTVELLRLLQTTEQGQLFKDELSALHNAIPLEQVHATINYLSEEHRFQTPKDRELKYIASQNTIWIDVINTDQLYTISGELIGIPEDEIKVKLYPPFVPGDTIRTGDTLAIHIPGLTPLGKPDQQVVLQAGNQAPVTGLPFQVASDGNVILPQVGKVAVVNKSIDQARETIINNLGGWVTEAQKQSVQVHFLMYVNQTQEIRRIIDPEVDRDVGKAESNDTALAGESGSNSVPREAVYNGKNVDTWLQVLQFEGNGDERYKASEAIRKIVSSQNQGHVRERVIEILQSNPNSEAFRLLPQLVGDEYFEVLARFLTDAKEDKLKIDFLTWSRLSFPDYTEGMFERIEPLLKWADVALRDRAFGDPLLMRARKYFAEMIFDINTSTLVQSKLAERVEQWQNFESESFWLNNLSASNRPLSKPICEAVLRQVKLVLAGEKNDETSKTKALFIANLIAIKNPQSYVAPIFEDLSPFIKAQLSKAAESVTNDNKDVEVQFQSVAQPSKVVKTPVNPTVLILRLLTHAGQGSLFKPELTSLHNAIPLDELKDYFSSMAQASRTVDYARFVKEMERIRANNDHTQNRATNYELYTLSGHLIGKSDEELQAEICPPSQPAGSIWVGDVLAIYVLGVTQPIQGNERPILLQAGNHPPVQGSPFEVLSDGTINLLTLGKISVAGKTIDQAKDAVLQQASKVLAKEIVRFVEVNFLMLSNQREEIRQILGPQTEAGNNVPIKNGASTQVSPADMRQATNPLLNEVVYEGKNLDAWLRVLELERSAEQSKAVNAIFQLINEKNRAEVLRRTLEILQNNPGSEARAILPTAAGDQYFVELLKLIQNADESGSSMLLDGCRFGFDRIKKDAFKNIGPFLDWMDSALRNKSFSDSIVQVAHELFVAPVFYGHIPPDAQSKVIDHVKTWSQFTTANFWIHRLHYGDEGWTETLCNVEMERVQEALKDPNSDLVLVAKSLALTKFIMKKRQEMVVSTLVQHPQVIENWLNLATNDFEKVCQDYRVDDSWSMNVRSTTELNPLFLTFEILKETKKAESFHDSLTRLHNAIPIKDVKDRLSNLLAQPQNRYYGLAELKKTFLETRSNELRAISNAYMISGELLGKSKDQLESEIYPAVTDPNLIRERDVLAINIPTLTPIPQNSKSYPPTIILQAGKRAPVPGMPFSVDASGNITLPIIGTIAVKGKSVEEIRDAIQANPKYQEMFGTREENIVDVNILMMAGLYQEVRQITGPAVDLPSDNDKPKR